MNKNEGIYFSFLNQSVTYCSPKLLYAEGSNIITKNSKYKKVRRGRSVRKILRNVSSSKLSERFRPQQNGLMTS